MLNMNEDREMERFAALAKSIAYELDLDSDYQEYVKDIIADWAVDSQSRNGIMMQVAAAQEFGATLSRYTTEQASSMGLNVDADMGFARNILRYIYNSASHYPITVYRATDFDGSNALESWTTEREIAEFYISRNGGGEIIEKTTDRYLARWCDGVGLECAREVIVIN